MPRLDDLLDPCPELMSASDVARLLGVTPRTVLTWLKDGAIPGVRLPSQWVVIREELREWLHQAHNQRGRDASAPPKEPDA